MDVWIQNGHKYISCLPSRLCDCMADWELGLTATAQNPKTVLGYTSPSQGKDPDSEFQVWFLLNEYNFCTTVMAEKKKKS